MGDDTPHVNRRKALKIAASGAMAAGLVESVAGESERKVHIPRYFGKDGAPKDHRKVPKRWKRYWDNAIEAKKSFSDEVRTEKGTLRLALTSTGQRYGRHGIEIVFEVFKDEYTGEKYDEYNGFDVDMRYVDKDEYESGLLTDSEDEFSTQSDHCWYNDHYWSTVFGGIPIWKQNSETPDATYAWTVEYNGDIYCLTPHHTWDDGSCSINTIGTNVEQNGRSFGTIQYQDFGLDSVLIEMDDLYDWEPEIANEEGTESWPISGYYRNAELSYMSAANDTVRKVGTATGETQGVITDYMIENIYECPNYEGHGVEVELDGRGGDSGPPLFRDELGYAVLVGMMTHEDPRTSGDGDHNCWGPGSLYTRFRGPAAYRLHDKFEIQMS
jgi:hypothetical protein